jgi:type I restriction enzyme, S subunit
MTLPRYPAYKDSGVEWLGEVPEHWEVAPLKRVATCNDDVLPENTSEEDEIEYVEISDVDAVYGITGTTRYRFDAAPSRARRRVRHGDTIVSTVRTYLRAIAPVVGPPSNLIVSTGFAVVRPAAGRVHPSLLGYALRAEGFIGEVIARSVGVSYPAINASDLMRLPIPLPPTREQIPIAAFLDSETAKIDALKNEVEHAIELLHERRSSLISAAVTGKIDVRSPVAQEAA